MGTEPIYWYIASTFHILFFADTSHRRKTLEGSSDPADTKTFTTGIVLYIQPKIHHLKLHTSFFFLQLKDLLIMQSQNTERHLQERSLGKIRLTLRLPQQVCKDLFFPQLYSYSRFCASFPLYPFHVVAEPIHVYCTLFSCLSHLQ